MKGAYTYVAAELVGTKASLSKWIREALAFNESFAG
jgi:hypothetical protein